MIFNNNLSCTGSAIYEQQTEKIHAMLGIMIIKCHNPSISSMDSINIFLYNVIKIR